MKNLYVLFLFLIISISHLPAQPKGVQCTYSATYIIPKGVLDIPDETTRNAVISQLSNTIKTYSLLYFNKKYLFDCIAETTEINALGGISSVYLDMNKDVSISQEIIQDRSFIIKEKITQYHWEITQETKEIAHRKCTKAILKDKPGVIAWFTFDIAFNFAPLGYNGLPGLVIQMETPTFLYTLQEIIFPETLTIAPPTKGKEITREKFNKLINEKNQEQKDMDGKVEIIDHAM